MKKVFKGVFTVLTVIAFAAYLLFLWLTVLQFDLKGVPRSGLIVSDIFLSVCTAVVAVIGHKLSLCASDIGAADCIIIFGAGFKICNFRFVAEVSLPLKDIIICDI